MRAKKNATTPVKHMVLITVSLILFNFSSKSQPLADIHFTGANVQFIFSTLNHYKNGITLQNRTTVRILYRNGVNPLWELKLKALDNEIAYDGSGSGITLNSLTFDIIAPGATVNTSFTLSESYQTIVSGGGGDGVDPAEFTVTISYELPAMINRQEGIYFVPLDFILVENGFTP